MLDVTKASPSREQAPASPCLVMVELTGSASALVDGIPLRFAPHRARPGIVPAIARALLREGRDPSTVVSVMRGSTPALPSASLATWAV